MPNKDDKRSKSAKHEMNPRSLPKSIGNGNGQSPSHSPAPGSRRRPRRAPSGPTPLRPLDLDSKHKSSRSPPLLLFFSTLDLYSKVTAKCALLTCVCGLGWASLIVWILGPAVSSSSADSSIPAGSRHHSSSRLLDRPGAFPIADHSGEGFLLPGWTPLGHHARFMGREAFPEQFEHWGEEGEVVINSVDRGPLTTGEGVLPSTDLLLAILSGDDKVRAWGVHVASW